MIRFYLENASLLRKGLEAVGIKVYGGVDAPYVWLKTPRIFPVGTSSIN
ncbi:MAG: hypothetical protein R3C11_22780 [Planctomycetaceae bacterium]